jgi:hypothetical protein
MFTMPWGIAEANRVRREVVNLEIECVYNNLAAGHTRQEHVSQVLESDAAVESRQVGHLHDAIPVRD